LTTHLVPLMSNTFSALITGSVFYDSQPVTSSLFSRSGVLFFALLLNALSAMTEVSLGYAARPILIRQANFGMIRPSADAIANSILMIPIKLLQMIPFVIIIYFMT
jgi:ATP-binding cassette subfamily G (WHITE) protein 2 (SNQ2)